MALQPKRRCLFDIKKEKEKEKSNVRRTCASLKGEQGMRQLIPSGQ
jgi:hypothetical protein